MIDRAICMPTLVISTLKLNTQLYYKSLNKKIYESLAYPRRSEMTSIVVWFE